MSWTRAHINLQRTVLRHAIDESIVVKNFAVSGSYTNGRWTDVTPVTGAVSANVQSAAGESLQLLPEGTRTTDAIEVWSTDEFRPLRRTVGSKATIIVWKGREYSAEVVEDWWQNGRYWFALCTLVDQ